MPALLISHDCEQLFGSEIAATLQRLHIALDLLVLPEIGRAHV